MNALVDHANRIDANRNTRENRIWNDGDIRTIGAIGHSANVITIDQLRQAVPSAFAVKAHARVSDRYSFLPTASVLEGLAGEGWLPVLAQEQGVRDEDRQGFQKHLIRFAHRDSLMSPDRPEIVLTNSSDRSSAYHLHAGIFRAVCMNGLIVCDATFASVSITHMDFDPCRVIDASVEISRGVPGLMGKLEQFRAITLSAPEKLAFAKAAHVLRFPDFDGDRERHAIAPAKLVEPRRAEDKHDDLYSVLNVVQENVVKGGQRGYQKPRTDEQGQFHKGRRVKSREVKGIDGNVNLNKALWTLAEEMAKVKA